MDYETSSIMGDTKEGSSFHRGINVASHTGHSRVPVIGGHRMFCLDIVSSVKNNPFHLNGLYLLKYARRTWECNTPLNCANGCHSSSNTQVDTWCSITELFFELYAIVAALSNSASVHTHGNINE